MSITAKDIQEQGFEHSLRGYDVAQVDEFLEKVALEIDALNNENEDLAAELDEVLREAETNKTVEVDAEKLKAAEIRAEKAEDEVAYLQDEVNDLKNRLKEFNEKDNSLLLEARGKIEELKDELAEKENNGDVISKAFIAAQRSADSLKEDARAEGERIYRESEAKAREFLREALVEKQRVLNEAENIQNAYKDFREQFRNIVEHFGAEAERRLDTISLPEVPDSAVNALLPDVEEIDNNAVAGDDVEEPQSDEKPAKELPKKSNPPVKPMSKPVSVSEDAIIDNIEEID